MNAAVRESTPPPAPPAPVSAPRLARGAVQSFEPRHEDDVRIRLEKVRVRLTDTERRLVRYVLTEWSGDAACGSPWPETQSEEAYRRQRQEDGRRELDAEVRERAAATGQPERWVRADLLLERSWRTMYVPKGGTGSKYGAVDLHGYPLLEGAENWCSRGRKQAAGIIRAWRALTALDRDAPALAVCLVRLYGDALPGDRRANPYDGAGSWGKDVSADYALVGDLVSPLPWVAWVDSVAPDTKRREGETPIAQRARTAAATSAKRAEVLKVAKKAEKLIEDAVLGYRACWAMVEA